MKINAASEKSAITRLYRCHFGILNGAIHYAPATPPLHFVDPAKFVRRMAKSQLSFLTTNGDANGLVEYPAESTKTSGSSKA